MDLARSEAELALRLDAHQVTALSVLGRIMIHEGRYNEAVRFLHKTLDRQDYDPMPHFYLSQSYEKIGDQIRQSYHLARFLRLNLKPRDALREFQKALKLLPSGSELEIRIKREIAYIRQYGV